MAKELLMLPVPTIAVELMFSTNGGVVIRKDRSRLAPDVVEATMCPTLPSRLCC